MEKLAASYYRNDDVVMLARDLLGKALYTSVNGTVTAGLITETEAYHQDEKACHAYQGRFTGRTKTLFMAGGVAYVYLCYGIHQLFNIVTGPQGEAQAVLVRGLKPWKGIDAMMKRRNMNELKSNLSSGPGTLSQAMGITTALNGTSLEGEVVWLEDLGVSPVDEQVAVSTRIGVDYAGKDAHLPWRFNLAVSKIDELVSS